MQLKLCCPTRYNAHKKCSERVPKDCTGDCNDDGDDDDDDSDGQIKEQPKCTFRVHCGCIIINDKCAVVLAIMML